MSAVAVTSRPYYPWFDPLRVVLASVVALAHDGAVTWHHAAPLAVDVFFALSGFLIGGVLLETPRAEIPHFYFNRATRIWIPYALAVAMLLGLSAMREPITKKWLEYAFYKVTFVYNWFGVMQNYDLANMPLRGTGHHFWSICAEEQFYLVAPIFLVMLPRFGRSAIFWTVVSVGAILADCYGAISLGVLAAVLRTQHGNGWIFRPVTRAALATVAVGSFVAMLFVAGSYLYVAPSFAVSVVLLMSGVGPKNKVAAFFGGVSYPFYLNHWVGIFAAHALFARFGMRDSLAAKIFGYLAGVAFASVLYVIVDKQVLERRRAWFTPRRGRALATVAFASVALGLAGGLFLMQRW